MGLKLGPAYVAWDIQEGDRIVLTPDGQMSDLTLTLNEPATGLKTQAATTDADMAVTGLEASATFSLADTDNLNYFSRIYHGAIKEQDPGSPSESIVSLVQKAGCRVVKRPALIVSASCDGPTSDPAGWFFMPYAGLFTQDSSLTFSKDSQRSLNVTLKAFPPPLGSIFYGKKLIRGNYRKFDATLPTIAQLFTDISAYTPLAFMLGDRLLTLENNLVLTT